jgi:hypothetical protein
LNGHFTKAVSDADNATYYSMRERPPQRQSKTSHLDINGSGLPCANDGNGASE